MKKTYLTKISLLIAIACLFLTSCDQEKCKMKGLSIKEYTGILLDENGVALDNVNSDLHIAKSLCHTLYTVYLPETPWKSG